MALDPEGGFEQLMAMGRGFQATKMLMTAVNLAVFDFLEEATHFAPWRPALRSLCKAP